MGCGLQAVHAGCGLRAVAMVLVGHAYCVAGRPLGAAAQARVPARCRAAGTVDAAGGVGLARVRRWAACRERGAEAPVGGLLQPGRPLGAAVQARGTR